MSGRRLDAARGILLAALLATAVWAGAYLLAHLAGNGWAP